MLGNSENMVMPSSTTSNEWPAQMDEQTAGVMASNGRVLEKNTGQEQQQQPHLKCPRCDSSNTKFCYYNNYSLSQPRHFCKACKRYWTRGGTLRNVPVGGGYRKNKRVKRPATSNDTTSSLSTTTVPSIHSQTSHQINVSSASNQMNPLFYGLHNNPSYINLSFPPSGSTGYDHHQSHQLSSMGLNFPPITMNGNGSHDEDYGGGFNCTTQVQNLMNPSNPTFSLFGSSSSRPTSPRTASMMASTFQQQKMMLNNGSKETRSTSYLQGLLPFQDLQMGGNDDPRMARKEAVKMEEAHHHNNQFGSNKAEWSTNHLSQNPVAGSSDSTPFWNSMSVGAWPDLTNYGSSVTSLI